MNSNELLNKFAQGFTSNNDGNYKDWKEFYDKTTLIDNPNSVRTIFKMFADFTISQQAEELEEILKKIRQMPNRDSWFQNQLDVKIHIAVLDGGGIKRFAVTKLLEKQLALLEHNDDGVDK